MVLNRLQDSGEPIQTVPDVQRTTFSLDGISRFVCNTWEEILGAQGGGQFDAIVIGSGMYGAYTAAKLFEFGRRMEQPNQAPRVLVLESGPFLITEHVQNLTRIGNIGSLVLENLVEPGQTNENTFVQHHRCIGGKSLFWGGWSPRLVAEDLDKVDTDGDLLWPADVKEYLFQNNQQDGYEYIEREIGAYPVQDFIRGPLYENLKTKSEEVVTDNKVNSLKAVLAPPIAVQGETPGSGLFSLDKFSSLPLLLDSIREDAEISGGSDAQRKLFLVPYAEVLKLETVNGRVTQVVVALIDPANPQDKSKARVVRLDLKPSAMVVIAGNTINSTRLALNSFPRPQQLAPTGELMGRNLMFHVRDNFTWRIRRDALNLPQPDPTVIKTAALHITGSTQTNQGVGQFHFQFYAAPNMDVPVFPGASKDPERFLYQMVPNIEDVESIREAQRGIGNDRIVVRIRTVGETFGDRTSPVGSNPNVSWMGVNPFGGTGDDIYGTEQLRVPKAYVNLVENSDDIAVRNNQSQAAFAFIEALANQPSGSAGIQDPNAPIEYCGGGADGIGTTYHESGTLWIGTDYTKSVTDANGRFHHVSNCYCVDQSIFPTVGSANPVPTGIALSRKIAGSIIERYQSVDFVGDEPGFQILYSGNFLNDDWKIASLGSQNFFDVSNQPYPVLGAGLGNNNVSLGVIWFTRQKFQDFILKLDWRAFDIEANSGIFLRMPDPEILNANDFYDSSIEVQIDEQGYDFTNNIYGSPLHKTGSVYEIFPAQRWAAKVFQSRNSGKTNCWNSYEIRVQGNEVEVKLNDLLVSSGTFAELLGFDAPSDGNKKRSEGYIGLQCHTEVVQFRNIRIKQL